MLKRRPVILCILDGWGYRENKQDNAIEMSNTPCWHRIVKENPTMMLQTSGLDVGLPNGQMGNSEVGHTNLGAGRVVMQDLPRIDKAIKTGEIKENPVLLELIETLKRTKGTCHLMGLMSPGGVHSHQRHIEALAHLLNEASIPVCIHAYLDGRDTPPDSALHFVQEFEQNTKDCAHVKLSTLCGRFYAMDRDNRWERVSKAYNMLTLGEGAHFSSAKEALEESYKNKIYDEFVEPVILSDYQGMKDGDAVLMANFRSDRAREILLMLLKKDFDKAPRKKEIQFASSVGMTEYSEEHNALLKTLFPAESLTHIYGEIISEAGLKQLRIAETEKYAHVTFFFNGGEEKKFDGEDRILIPSPKVATYDMKPEMSAFEVTDNLVEAIKSEKYDTIIVNYANGDMVGHTGVLSAAIKAVEAVDTCLARLESVVKEVGGVMFITADHGNCELMKDEKTNAPYTAHTNTPVKALLLNPPEEVKAMKDGRLADVAPTLLALLGLPKPVEMTGESLLVLKKED
ncbi:MAG: 2,3-bisphosphoglycerate-independent phosphoglycerate mutase [Alphaproteobacteria bacterium]|nr:2,3-bisphosphoglycerate-independent phosphoglycerate mutase [Alphaproteobacteria bacterium]